MSTPLDADTLLALRDEARDQADIARQSRNFDHTPIWMGRAAWLQEHLDALPKERTDRITAQYRLLWTERIAGQMIGFSGKVTHDVAVVQAELESRKSGYNYHNLMIEARPASKEPWPVPDISRIPPDLAGALREWRVWVDDRPISYSIDVKLAAAIDAAEKRGEL